MAFDVHLSEILAPLTTGFPIVSAPRALLLEDLPFYIKELHISHIGIVPSLIEATMNAVQDDVDSGHLTSLRYLASGGEKMSNAVGTRSSWLDDLAAELLLDSRQMGKSSHRKAS